MYHVTFLCIGSLKENYWKAAEQEYRTRLSPWLRIAVHEIKETPLRKGISPDHIRAKEGVQLLAAVPRESTVIVLDPMGNMMTSEHYASVIQTGIDQGRTITFIIGGPLGISEEVRARADMVWSLSPLTFTHQIARVLVHEQLYRALTIIKNKTYHY